MNRLKYIFIFLILIACFQSKSQSIKVNELLPFVKIDKGEYTTALALLDELIKENTKIEFFKAKIDVLINLEQYPEALLICDQLDKINPENSGRERIKIYQQSGTYQELETEVVKNKKSRDKISLYDYLTNEDYTIAQDIALKKNQYTLIEKQIYQTRLLVDNEKYSQALFIVEEILAQGTTDSEVFFLQSKIAYGLKDYKKSNYAIVKAISLNPTQTAYYRQKALINLKIGNYNAALESANKLIRKEEYVVDNYILKLEILVADNQFEESSILSNILLELIPENKKVLMLNGKSLFKTGDYLGALKSTNHLLEIEKTKEAFELRGDVYMATNTFQFAEYDYSMYLDIYPLNGDVYAKKGFARYKQGNLKGACSDWEKGIRYGSYNAIKYKEQYCK